MYDEITLFVLIKVLIKGFGILGVIGIIILIVAESTILIVGKIHKFFSKFMVDETNEKKENLSKRYIDDFLTKYPNATVDINGVPYVRPCLLGYYVKTNSCSPPLGCVYCWNQELEE